MKQSTPVVSYDYPSHTEGLDVNARFGIILVSEVFG
jgi:hypothetical protein